MKLTAKIVCPHCYSDNDGFDLELENINTKTIVAYCKNCSNAVFKVNTSSIIEVDKNGNVVNNGQ